MEEIYNQINKSREELELKELELEEVKKQNKDLQDKNFQNQIDLVESRKELSELLKQFNQKK